MRGAGGRSAGAAAASGYPGAKRDYAACVVAIISRENRYPSAARNMREHGGGRLAFTVDASVRAVAASLRQRTGHVTLDAGSLELIRGAAPLPRIPPEIRRDPLDFVVPIDFALR